jgi:signal transduction histidine kinase
MEMFIGEILDYSRSKRQEIHTESIDLRKLCHDIFDNLKFIEGSQTIRFDTTGIEENEITTDKTRLKIILNNLIANAIQYQKINPNHEPQITITSRKENSKGVTISVDDNGEGIKQEYLQKIFDMFYRCTEKSGGSGLGLYIAKEAADKVGGVLKIESTYGIGTTCKLILPLSL